MVPSVGEEMSAGEVLSERGEVQTVAEETVQPDVGFPGPSLDYVHFI